LVVEVVQDGEAGFLGLGGLILNLLDLFLERGLRQSKLLSLKIICSK
jgi:hypothetical protein